MKHHDFQCNDPNCAAHRGIPALKREIAERIEKKFWTVMSSHTPSPLNPAMDIPVSYTIGLQAQGLPELLIYGMPQDAALSVLNQAAQRLVEGQLQLDTPVHGLLVRHPVLFKQTEPELLTGLFQWIRLYAPDHQSANIWQLVWPDEKGLYPWQEEFNPEGRFFFVQHYRDPGVTG